MCFFYVNKMKQISSPVKAAIVLGLASVVAGGVKGYYDSKHGGTDFSVVGYSAVVQGVVGGVFGFYVSHIASSFMLGSGKPKMGAITVCTGAGIAAGATKGGLETTVGYVFGYGLGKLV